MVTQQNKDYITDETVIQLGEWSVPLRNISAWRFETSGSGIIFLVVSAGYGPISLPTYARNEGELRAYFTNVYSKKIADFLMGGSNG